MKRERLIQYFATTGHPMTDLPGGVQTPMIAEIYDNLDPGMPSAVQFRWTKVDACLDGKIPYDGEAWRIVQVDRYSPSGDCKYSEIVHCYCEPISELPHLATSPDSQLHAVAH